MKKSIGYLVSLFIFKTVLEISYFYFLYPKYEYLGFHLDFNLLKYFESNLAVLLIYFVIPKKGNPSNVSVSILNIVMIIPIITLYSLKNESRIYFYSVVVSFLILNITLRSITKVSFSLRYNLNGFLKAGFILTLVVVYGLLIRFNGMPSLRLFDFNEVYNVRGNVNYGYGFMDYLVPWLGSIVNIFVLIIAFYSRKKWSLIAVSFLQVVLYLLSSHKTFLFYPFAIFGLIFVFRKRKLKIGKTVALLTSCGVLAVLFIFKLSGNLMLPSMIVSRIFFLPAQISFQYYEYFSQNGLVLLSHSILSFAFKEPIYSIHPIKLIGQTYYSNNWPNTGYLGDAYMNFGIPGMIFFSIILGIVLRVIDSLANTPFKESVAKVFIVLFMFSLSNMGLLTSMLNGGLLVFITILYLYNDKDKQTISIAEK